MASSFMADYKGRLYPRYGLIGGQGPYGLPCDDEEVEVRLLMLLRLSWLTIMQEIGWCGWFFDRRS